MDIATFRSLVGAEGADLLEEATRSYGSEDDFALGSRLRRGHPPALVAAALTQARLRLRATAKFASADARRMLFTVDGYEQATRAVVAQHRAARIAAASPDRPVADLCCGIGGDLIALARAGPTVTGVEADELTAYIARQNIAALGLDDRARVVTADATTVDRTPFAAVTCDPARRTGQGRVFRPEAYQPPWSFVVELLAGDACVKVAPGIPHDHVPSGVEAEWVSEAGEVKEAALWSGTLAATAIRRRATILSPDDGHTVATVTDTDDPGPGDVRPPGRYIYEPDGAVIRAGLVTVVADAVGGWLIDPSIAYVATDTRTETPLARAYEVVDTLPYDVKRLRRYVRDQNIGVVTVKKRGVDVSPEQLRRDLRPRGDAETTLVVTRASGRAVVLVARPLTAAAGDTPP